MSKDTDRDAQRCPNDGQTLAWHLETGRDGRTNGAFLGCAFGAPSLPVFLLARLDEDEAVAREAIDPDRPGTHWAWSTPDDNADPEAPRWLRTVEEFPTTSGVGPLPAFPLGYEFQPEPARAMPHIARHSPARVLADVEAKRRIVAVCDDYEEPSPTVLRLLALPYADHPDYRAEWAL